MIEGVTSSFMNKIEMQEELVKYVEYMPKSYTYLIVLVTSVSTQSSSNKFSFIKSFSEEV